MSQIGGKHLALCSHDSTHGSLNSTNWIVATLAIPVNHLKLDFLLLLKEVIDCEMCLEVRVQVVLDLLRLAQLDPLLSLVIVLTQDADGIRLAKHI